MPCLDNGQLVVMHNMIMVIFGLDYELGWEV